ncbi:hypothetical protein KOR42_39230 [Thalassoglobus neptunius]|uniref:Uncharacterized protein n=1 Tax=Thalassoglobus neptunius TaxID=1938619 RepID=A0A5C5WER8_9PLAN|nr:hypothetical protein [Thalassoglobus neptunius]TWT49007.1 hypothetical protein KOR42_39230 [Thalassoglobus neptunius]
MTKCNTQRFFESTFVNLLKIDKSGGGLEWAACERIHGNDWGEPTGPIAQAYDGLYVFEQPAGTIRLVNSAGFNSWVSDINGKIDGSSSFSSSGAPFVYLNTHGAAATSDYLYLGQNKFDAATGAYIKNLNLSWTNAFNAGDWGVAAGGESFDYISNLDHFNRWDDTSSAVTINKTDFTFRQSPDRNRTLLDDGTYYYPWFTNGTTEGIAQVAISDLSIIDTFVDNTSGLGAGGARQAVRDGLLVYSSGANWSLIETATMSDLWEETDDWLGSTFNGVTGLDCCSEFAVACGNPAADKANTVVARDLNGDLLWGVEIPLVVGPGSTHLTARPIISQDESLVFLVGAIQLDSSSSYYQAIAALDATDGSVVWSLRHVGGPRRAYGDLSDWGVNLIESGSSIYLAKRSHRGPTYR